MNNKKEPTPEQIYIHEIRNKINIIYGIAQIIEKTNKPHKQRRKTFSEVFTELTDSKVDLTDTLPHNKQLDLLIKTIKDMKQLDAQYRETKINHNLVLVDIAAILFELIDVYKNRASIGYQIAIAETYANPDKIKQILHNLLSNACKYNTNQKPNIYIKCNKDENGKIHITIRDNGIGMTEKEISQVGQPGYRCKKIERDGDGLGLSIVYSICREYGYVIKFRNNADYCKDSVGLNVTIYL